MPGSKFNQPATNFRRRLFCRHAVHVRTARCGRCRCVRHLAGIGRCDANASNINLKLIGDDLCNLRIQALPHFRAAMIELHGAVLVHVHQGTRLVQQGAGKGNAELHRRDGNTAFKNRTRGIELAYFIAPCTVLAARQQLIENLINDVVFDRLLYGVTLRSSLP